MTETSNIKRIQIIKERLNKALEPVELNVIDDSLLHSQHNKDINKGGHFNIQVVSEHFIDKSAIERHRMIYLALGDAIGTAIHALSIKAKTPEEVAQ